MNLLPHDRRHRTPEFAEAVLAKVHETKPLVHRLVLIVGRRGAGKTACLCEVARRTGDRQGDRPVLNVGLELSRRLLDLAVRGRPHAVADRTRDLVADAGEPALLDNLEILFQRDLRVNPLVLLQQLSRDRTVVAAFRGHLSEGVLRYAEPGHPEYRAESASEFLLVDLNPPAERRTP